MIQLETYQAVLGYLAAICPTAEYKELPGLGTSWTGRVSVGSYAFAVEHEHGAVALRRAVGKELARPEIRAKLAAASLEPAVKPLAQVAHETLHKHLGTTHKPGPGYWASMSTSDKLAWGYVVVAITKIVLERIAAREKETSSLVDLPKALRVFADEMRGESLATAASKGVLDLDLPEATTSATVASHTITVGDEVSWREALACMRRYPGQARFRRLGTDSMYQMERPAGLVYYKADGVSVVSAITVGNTPPYLSRARFVRIENGAL